jgi:MarR-like DNA-binding transcriptional regulator SgrR of sgrS sRNA
MSRLAFTILILIGGLVSYSQLKSNSEEDALRVAFPSKRPVASYEPTNIHVAYEYILLENLYSPLVEIDPKGGQVLPAIAESFQWEGPELHFKIRSGLKTASGIPITASDVVFSLKRVVLLSQNTHGNFRDLVCPGETLNTVEDECSGIAQQGDVVILKPGLQKTVLLPMLAAIDFAIIPKSAVDPKTLAITSFSETSGLYHLEKQLDDGSMLLKQNPNHFRNEKGVAKTVKLVAFDPKLTTALSLLEGGKVDHIPTTNATKLEDILAYAQAHSDVQLHATMKIKNFVLIFTDRGKTELSSEQRRAIGQKVRAAFSKIYSGVLGYHASEEFFPALGDGGLSDSQRSEVHKLLENAQVDVPANVRIGLFKSSDFEQWANPIREVMANADLYLEKDIPDLHKYDKIADMPHAIIAGTDTGFMEDINLISYSLNTGFLGLKKDERQKWISNYMALKTKEERILALKALHFKALSEAAIVPLVISPFVALARKPWKMELSELYANNQLWLIKR